MQIGRKYLQEKRTELPKTVGRNTLFVKEILEKNGQGESFVFDPASLVYLQPAAQKEELKEVPDEERARDYVLREKETMKLITREEKSKNFFSNIIRERVLPGAVEMLREKSWKKQLSIQLQVLLKEYHDLEQQQQIFLDNQGMLEIHSEKQELNQAWMEFRKELAVLDYKVENWEQETGTTVREEHLRKQLEEQVDKLFVCRQVLEEREKEWLLLTEKQLDEVILKVLREQPELQHISEQPREKTETLRVLERVKEETEALRVSEHAKEETESLRISEHVKEEMKALQISEHVKEDAETLRVLEHVKEETEALQVSEHAKEETETLRVLEHVEEEMNALQVSEHVKEDAETLRVLEHAKEKTEALQVSEYAKEETESLPVLESPREPLLRSAEHRMEYKETMQSGEAPEKSEELSIQPAELLHRIRKEVLEQALESRETSAGEKESSRQDESRIDSYVRQKIQKLTREEAVELRRELLYREETEKNNSEYETIRINAGENAKKESEERAERVRSVLRELPKAAEKLDKVILSVLKEETESLQISEHAKEETKELRISEHVKEEMKALQISEHAKEETEALRVSERVKEETEALPVLESLRENTGLLRSAEHRMEYKETMQSGEAQEKSEELSIQPAELLHRIRKEVLEQALESRETSAGEKENSRQDESRIDSYVRQEIQKLTREEAVELRRELLYREETEKNNSEYETIRINAGENAEKESEERAERVRSVLRELPKAAEKLDKVILSVLKEEMESLRISEHAKEETELLQVSERPKEETKALQISEHAKEKMETLRVLEHMKEEMKSLQISEHAKEETEALPVLESLRENTGLLRSAEHRMEYKETMQSGEAQEKSEELSIQPAELLHRIRKEVLEKTLESRETSAAEKESSRQDESRIDSYVRQEIQKLTREEAVELRRGLLYREETEKNNSEYETIWINAGENAEKESEEKAERVRSVLRELPKAAEKLDKVIQSVLKEEMESLRISEHAKELQVSEHMKEETNALQISEYAKKDAESLRVLEHVKEETETLRVLEHVEEEIETLRVLEHAKEETNTLQVSEHVKEETEVLPVLESPREQLLRSAEHRMEYKETMQSGEVPEKTEELSIQPAELLHRIRKEVLEQALESRETSAGEKENSRQDESRIDSYVRQEVQKLTREEAAAVTKELLYNRKSGQNPLERETVRINVEQKSETVMMLLQRELPSVVERLDKMILNVLETYPEVQSESQSQVYRLVQSEIEKLTKEKAVEITKEQLLHQIREQFLKKMIYEIRKEEYPVFAEQIETKLQNPEFTYKIVQEILEPEQREQFQHLFSEIFNNQILLRENVEETQVFRVLRLLREAEMPVKESMSEEDTEVSQQDFVEMNHEISESGDIMSWQQLAERPGIRELIESREIRVPEKQKETDVKLQETNVRLNHYQNHAEKIEQLREENQEQFRKLMEQVTLQEEQIIRIENWHQELKERVQEQEEKQEMGNQEEKILQKLQEQLRMERLRRGLI